jgi:uridine kinase
MSYSQAAALQGGALTNSYAKACQLIKVRAKKIPLLVAIDGQSAAGKSTLARFIEEQLPDVTIVHADDFYRVMDEQERAALDAEGGYNHYYDWERLQQQVLEPLTQTQSAQYQRYNWVENMLGEWVEVLSQGIVVVEGVYTLRPELRHYYDVKIYVATNDTVRMERQAQRSDPWLWVERWDAAELWYLQHHTPALVADFVIEQ